MIEYKTGDIFAEDAEALVNSVNCVGVMGRGIALAFKRRFKDNYAAYRAQCEANEMQPGRVFIHERRKPTLERPLPLYIINFPTKRHWRSKSRPEDVEAGLDDLAVQIQRLGIQSVAMPAIASDLGGLPWTWVRKQIDKRLAPLSDHGVDVTVFEPGSGESDGRPNPSRPVPPMDRFAAALVHIIDTRATDPANRCVSEQEVQDMMYLLQESGGSLGLEFRATSQGPHGARVTHKLRSLRPHYVTFRDGECNEQARQICLVPGSALDANNVVESVENMRLRFERVQHVVQRGGELPLIVATAQAAIETNPHAPRDQIVSAVQRRSADEPAFKKTHIRKAVKALRDFHVLPPVARGGRKPRSQEGNQLALSLDFPSK